MLTFEKGWQIQANELQHGNLENVDLLTDDLCNEGHVEDDWYKPMAFFVLEKLSSSNIKGKGWILCSKSCNYTII